MEAINTVGRRKAAVARIYVNDGKGQITINHKDYKEYFPEDRLQYVIEQPLKLAELEGKFDIIHFIFRVLLPPHLMQNLISFLFLPVFYQPAYTFRNQEHQ